MNRSVSPLKVVYSTCAVLIFGLVSCPLWGQALPKKKLTDADYHLWGTLQPEAVSATGKWASYYMTNDRGNDTLFVKSTSSAATYAFPNAAQGCFNSDSQFLFTVASGGMELLDTSTGKLTMMPDAECGSFTCNQRYLVTYEKMDKKERALLIRTAGGSVRDTIPNVSSYAWNTAKDALAYVVKNAKESRVYILPFTGRKKSITVMEAGTYKIHTLTWSSDDDCLLFYGDADTSTAQENILCSYQLKNGQLFRLTPSHAKGFPKGMAIGKDRSRALTISDDGKKVFFGLKGHNDTPWVEDEYVQLWNGNNKRLYPEAKAYRSDEFYELAVWWPLSGKVRQITGKGDSFVMLAGSQNYALTGSSVNYDPQYKGVKDMDLYLTELSTGKTELLLRKQPTAISQLRTSPDGNFIYYYRGSDWWSYSVSMKKHFNLTSGIATVFDTGSMDPANQLEVYGLGGYTKDRELLVYDYYDIWALSSDGKAFRRLTKGRENNMQYRLVPENQWQLPYNYSGASLENIDLAKPVWLRTFDINTGVWGYSVLHNTTPETLTDGFSASHLITAGDDSSYIFINQRFDLPPQLIYGDSTGRHIMVYQSNPHHFQYSWGKSVLIQYKTQNEKTLNAALYYPADYDENKKYPMIVYIYDIVSRDINSYVNPALRNNYGFNIAHLTANGYLVLKPDIMYAKGNTGKSAVECVEAAVLAARSWANIDTSAIGLFGHSFGGYETNFIVSHSDIFAAAVSGSAVSDVVRAYFSVHTDSNTADMWRYESQQYRLGSMLYDNPDIYLDNSPVLFADKVNTPLLLFAGKMDGNVRHEQSIEMYLALRRLNKTTALLLYPKEGHVLFDPAAQEDLTIRVGDWFDYFLKKEHSHDWITKGVK